MLSHLADLFTQMDQRLSGVIQTYQAWTYLILFGLILLETFPILTPVLPGGSLVLAAGALAARGCLNVWSLLPLLALGSALGDSVNYLLGEALGKWVFRWRRGHEQEHRNLMRARAFYRRYGSLVLVVGRFLPLVRTVAPTVAGMGVMNYRRFLLYDAAGCLLWTACFLMLGYFFGHVPYVRDHLLLLVIAIAIMSALPVVIHDLRQRRGGNRAPQGSWGSGHTRS